MQRDGYGLHDLWGRTAVDDDVYEDMYDSEDADDSPSNKADTTLKLVNVRNYRDMNEL